MMDEDLVAGMPDALGRLFNRIRKELKALPERSELTDGHRQTISSSNQMHWLPQQRLNEIWL